MQQVWRINCSVVMMMMMMRALYPLLSWFRVDRVGMSCRRCIVLPDRTNPFFAICCCIGMHDTAF